MKLSHNIVILDERIVLVGENLKSNYILQTISRRLDLYVKDYNKETVTKDEHAEIVFHILKEFREEDQK